MPYNWLTHLPVAMAVVPVIKHGIDVHGGKGRVDFGRERGAGVAFAYVKATEGLTFNDPLFAHNLRAAQTAGLQVGAYHFARPDLHPGVSGALQEAAHFLRVAQPRKGQLLPVLDFEHAPADPVWALTWLRAVERAIGAKPILYTYPAFLSQMGGGPAARALRAYPLWFASYGANDGHRHPLVGADGFRVVVHQYTSVGREPGVLGDVDEDALLVPLSSITLGFKASVKKVIKKPVAAMPDDSRFWLWLRWRLGEGEFAGRGVANPALRPKVLPRVISPRWWAAARAFLAARQ